MSKQRLVVLAIALVLGLCSAWQLTEQDIFWQIRAGEELWQGRGFPEIDSWSFTAAGKPWWNVQWLSTLLFAAAYHFGPPGLVVLRCALVALLFWRAGETVLAVVKKHDLGIAGALLPLVWVACAFRLELRSDTLVFLVFTELLLRRARGALVWWQPPVAVVLAANLHVGTAPFVALLALVLCAVTPLPKRVLVAAASCVALFVTPYHVRVLGFWWRHLDYAGHTVMQNPDHQPLSPAHHFDPEAFGLYGVCWLGLTVFALFGFWLRRAAKDRYLAVTFATFLVLTAMCIDRIRVFPYQLLFLLPHLARSLELALELVTYQVASSIVAAFGFFVGVRQVTHSKLAYGLSLSRAMYPLGSAAFIEREHVQPNLFHTFAYGAYTVYALKDYQDFVDTRETMFDGLQAAILDAYSSPALTRQLLDRYGINATLVPIPKTEAVGTLGYRNAIAEYLPQEQWALVYFDDISIVVVRRIPEHAELIARHEYQLLFPNVPPGNYLRTHPKAAGLARYRAEIERCLAEEPTNAYCMKTRALVEQYR